MSARHKALAQARGWDFESRPWQLGFGVLLGAFLAVLVLS